jgi:uncharacterized protein HemX
VSRAQVVSIGLRRSTTQDLTHIGLAVTPRRRRGRWLVTPALVLLALAAGAGIGYTVRDRTMASLPQPVPVAPEFQALRQQLEQARLGSRLSEARSHELERQIDSLNQRLTESQDELAFFRRAREGKR